jgi:hypothetical protein
MERAKETKSTSKEKEMRKKIKELNEERRNFSGIFVRFGKKNNYMGNEETTVLLKDIKDNSGKILCDHLWFNFTKGFEKINLKENDIVRFDARVKSYIKGYKGYNLEREIESPLREDFKLSHPTKIIKEL